MVTVGSCARTLGPEGMPAWSFAEIGAGPNSYAQLNGRALRLNAFCADFSNEGR